MFLKSNSALQGYKILCLLCICLFLTSNLFGQSIQGEEKKSIIIQKITDNVDLRIRISIDLVEDILLHFSTANRLLPCNLSKPKDVTEVGSSYRLTECMPCCDCIVPDAGSSIHCRRFCFRFVFACHL